MPKKYKETQFGKIPEEWKVVKLDSVAKRYTGHTPNKKNDAYWNGEIPWISLKDTNKLDNLYISQTTDYTTIEGINNSSATLLPPGAIVISRDATIGKVGIIKSEMATSQHFVNYVCGDKLNNIFLYYFLLFNRPMFERIAIGSTIKTIGLSFFKKFEIVLPTIFEQKKIATILSTVDEYIDTIDGLIENQKLLKKGLMQKLFSKGIGDKKIRKRGHRLLPQEWKILKLRDITIKIIGGGTPSRKVDEYFTGTIPWATVKDIGDSIFQNDTIEHITSTAIEESSTKLIEKNNIIIATRMGLGRGSINTVPMAINQDLKAIYPKKNVDVLFLMYWYLSKKKIIESLGKGSTVKGIKLEDVKELEICLPPLEEQKQIASILSSVDERIELYEQEREDYQQLKKGLMQQLLTGKVRVKLD